MEEEEWYPQRLTEKDFRVSHRRKFHQVEARALGNPARTTDPEPVDDARLMHGRMIRPGVRPLLKVSRTSRFAEHMTERQRRRGKVRTARSWGRMLKTLKETGMSLEEFVETLDPEELVYGKLKDKNGKFTGRPPAWVPREFHRACIRELMRRGKRMWQESYLDAIDVMVRVAKGEVKGVSGADRLKAAMFIVERIEGKVPERLEVIEESPWQSIIAEIMTEVPDDYVVQAKAARAELTSVVQSEIHEAELVEEEKPLPPRRSAARRARRTQ